MQSTELQNTVEVKVQASFSSSDGYSDWVSARPEFLLLKVLTLALHDFACIGTPVLIDKTVILSGATHMHGLGL